MFLSFVSFLLGIFKKITIWRFSSLFLEVLYLVCWNIEVFFIKQFLVSKPKLFIILLQNFVAKLLDLFDHYHYLPLFVAHTFAIKIGLRFMQIWNFFLFHQKLISRIEIYLNHI